MEETKSALELRIRLVHEVAAPSLQASLIEQELTCHKDAIKRIQDEQKKFIENLGAECVRHFQTDTFSVEEATKSYRETIRSNTQIIQETEKKMEEIKAEKDALQNKAREAMSSIVQEVLGGIYGRGELNLSQRGLVRIIGRIDYLNESTSQLGISLLKEHDLRMIQTFRVAQMCEQQNQQPPLFHVGLELMPLTDEELESLCWDKDDYKLLTKFIPPGKIVWAADTVFCLERCDILEIYAVPWNNDSFELVRIKKFNFPDWTMEFLGTVTRNDFNMSELLIWGGLSKFPVETEKSSGNKQGTLRRIEGHVSKKYPGVRIKAIPLEE